MSLSLALRMAPWVAILFLLVYAGRLNDLRERHLHRAEAFEARLKAISTEKNEQKSVTNENVGKARIIYRDADKKAQRVEQAPLPGQCATPEAVLGADL